MKAARYQMNMRATWFLGWLLAAALAAPQLMAQEAAPPVETAPADDSEILVERERIIDVRAASALVRAVSGRAQSREPLPRFNVPLCLSLAIDDPERGVLIGRRIIANARAAGLTIAKRGCRPNALVIVREDVRQWIIDYRRSGRQFIGRMKRHQVDRVLRSRDPAYAFQDIEVIVASPRGRVDRNTRKNIRSAAVMMDRAASAQFTPDQVADYITLRLLAPTREMDEVAGRAPRTILTLFRVNADRQAEMSRFDRTYLATLYRLRFNATAMEVAMTTARMLATDGGR
jgi:hypothetical protein